MPRLTSVQALEQPESEANPRMDSPAAQMWPEELSRDPGGDFIDPQPMEEDPVQAPRTVAAEQKKAEREVAPGEKLNCWGHFSRGVRGLWATRLTEDFAGDREKHVKTTLRELIIYCLFLTSLCFVAHGMVDDSMFYYSNSMQNLFLESPFSDNTNNFRGMTGMHEFWKFSQHTLLDGIHQENWYNNKPFNDSEIGYVLYENKLLGRARLRQLKVRSDSCAVHEDFQREIKECFDAYAKQTEDKQVFGAKNGTYTPGAWTYKEEADLRAGNHWGLISTYGGGGYVQKLGGTRNESEAILQELFNGLWLDRGTRAVFIDFNIYNGNLNLFCIVRLLVEFPATGGVVPSWFFRTIKLIRYVTPFDYFVLFCECIFFLFIIYYIVEEFLEIKRHRCAYFKSLFNILDIVIIVTSVICAAFNIYRYVTVSKDLERLLKDQTMFIDFEFISYWQVAFNYAIAWMVFFTWIKLFKYVSFNKTMSQLSSTLAKCAKDVAGFAVMFFIIFFAYAQLGYLIFGTQVRDFRSFIDACFTQFRIVLGDFDFHELEQANRVLGPIYFMTYVFFVFFVLLNMFLAIINDTYSEVKSDLATKKSEFQMGDYVKRGYAKMIAKLNIKRDKVMSLQQALQEADINNDQKIEFSEWRSKLRMQGHSEQEIEAIFARYDKDGDRVLDLGEQQEMRKDLDTLQDLMELDATDPRRSKSQASFDSDESEPEGRKSPGLEAEPAAWPGVTPGVAYEEFTVLTRRVDRMEHSIGSIMSKIDAVLVKLEAMEKAKLKRKETMGRILNSISESDSFSEEGKREQMERLVRQELDRWDSESSLQHGARSGSSGSRTQKLK